MKTVQSLNISHLGPGQQSIAVPGDSELLTVTVGEYGPVLSYAASGYLQMPRQVVIASDGQPLPDLHLRWIGSWPYGPGIHLHLFEVQP